MSTDKSIESAYRRGVHQALSFAHDVARDVGCRKAASLLADACDLAGEFRFDNKPHPVLLGELEQATWPKINNPAEQKQKQEPGTQEKTSKPLAYTLVQAAEQLGVSDRHLSKCIHKGELKSFAIGVSRRISHEALVEFIRSKEQYEIRGKDSSSNGDKSA